MTISFETKVWEGDWEIILKTSRIKDVVARCNHSFDEKILYINNVKDFDRVATAADKLIQAGILTKYINVAEHADEALNFFCLSKKKLGEGYYYSIAELVSIYLSKTEYLLHFSGDSKPAPKIHPNWLKLGINTLQNNPKVKVFNLCWNKNYKEAKNESFYEDDLNFYGYGFSDQMYLVRTDDFRQKIYEFYDVASERYPKYGGELFEKRVDSWMRQNSYLRATYKHGSYFHKNFVRNFFKKNLSIYLNSPNLFKGK